MNQKYFVGDNGALEFNPAGDGNADVDGDGVGDLPIMKRLRQVDDEFDAQIIEYDDEFDSEGIVGLGSELVFSIILNKTEKRITVVFRGRVSVKDWIKDLSFVKTNPDPINEFAGDKVGIHTGFSGKYHSIALFVCSVLQGAARNIAADFVQCFGIVRAPVLTIFNMIKFACTQTICSERATRKTITNLTRSSTS